MILRGVATVLACAVLSLVAGCYDTPKPACAFLCGTGGACPDGYSCSTDDNRCHLVQAGGGLAACPDPLPADAMRIDASTIDGPTIDASPIDATPLDAMPLDAMPIDSAPPIDAMPIDSAPPIDSMPLDAPPPDA